jgi:hypothetical protein
MEVLVSLRGAGMRGFRRSVQQIGNDRDPSAVPFAWRHDSNLLPSLHLKIA